MAAKQKVMIPKQQIMIPKQNVMISKKYQKYVIFSSSRAETWCKMITAGFRSCFRTRKPNILIDFY